MTVHLGVRCERDGCKAHLWRTSQPGERIADLVDVCPEHAAVAAA